MIEELYYRLEFIKKLLMTDTNNNRPPNGRFSPFNHTEN